MRISILAALPLLAAIPFVAHGADQHAKGKGKHMSAMHAAMVDTGKISGGSYVADSSHTLVGWRVSHFGFNDYFGQFGSATGTLTLDKANPDKSSVTMDIPISGLSTASEKLSGHMKSKDFFNIELHPAAKFVSNHLIVKGQHATIHGSLTMLGVTKPITLEAKLSGAGANPYSKKETVGFHAKGQIKRSDWGMGYGIPNVSDAVDLDITVAFEK